MLILDSSVHKFDALGDHVLPIPILPVKGAPA